MRNQFNRMAELAALSNVTVQVVLFSLGAYAGLKNAFTLLQFISPQSPVVFVESTAGDLYLERYGDLARHEESLERLRAGALDPDSSVRLFKRLRRSSNPDPSQQYKEILRRTLLAQRRVHGAWRR